MLLALSELGIVFYSGLVSGIPERLENEFKESHTFIVEDLLPHFIVKIAAGIRSCVALSSDGKLFAW